MNFIKHKIDRIIVQREKIAICKHMDIIQTTPRANHDENLIKEIVPTKIEIYEEINLEVENKLIKHKLKPLIEKLRKYGTIGEILSKILIE